MDLENKTVEKDTMENVCCAGNSAPDILSTVTSSLGLEKKDVRQLPALTLAYLGDCIYELVIRTMLVERGIMHVSELSKASVGYVKATAQKDLFQKIESLLSEEEIAAFKRGRNVKSSSCAKNASITDYRIATGFEALMGYLYVQGRFDRILELVKKGIEK